MNEPKKVTLETMLKERYNSAEKIAKGFYLRTRPKEIKVYYNGVKAFELNNGKLSLNVNMFLPNSKNVFYNGQKSLDFENVPKFLLEDAREIEKYFVFKMNETLTLPFSTKPDLDEKKIMTLYNEVKEEIERNFDFLEVLPLEENKKAIKLKRKSNQSLTFENLYKIKYRLIDFNDKYRDEDGKSDFQSMQLTVSCILKPGTDIDEIGLNKVEEIIKKRIAVYTGKTLELNRTKYDTNQEKQVQQDLMVVLNKKEHGNIHLIDTDEKKTILLFSENAYPFEMEYTIYAGKDCDSEEDDEEIDTEEQTEEYVDIGRARSNIKGRIDNVFIDGKKLILGEIKYGSSVISGTNGIHKHLIDLYTCLKHNKGLKKEIIDRVNYRNIDLEASRTELQDFTEIEYDIICFYNPKCEYTKKDPDYEEIKNKLIDVLGMLKANTLQKMNDIDNDYNKKVLQNIIIKENKNNKIKNILEELNSSFNEGTEDILSRYGVLKKLNNIVDSTSNNIEDLKENLLTRGKIIQYEEIKEILKKKYGEEIMQFTISDLIEKVKDIKFNIEEEEAKKLNYMNADDTRFNAYMKNKCKNYFLDALEGIQALAEKKSKNWTDLTNEDLSNPNQYDLEILDWNVDTLMNRLKKDFNCSVSIIVASSEFMEDNNIIGKIYKSNKE